MRSYCSQQTLDTYHVELTGDEMREIIVAGMNSKGMKIPDQFDIELTLDASQFTWREISHASMVWVDTEQRRVDFDIIDDPDNVMLVNHPVNLTRDEANLLDNARSCGGIEVRKPNWSIAESLTQKGYGTLSAARGPEKAWKRFEPDPKYKPA